MKAPAHYYLMDSHLPAGKRYIPNKSGQHSKAWKTTLKFIAEFASDPALAEAATSQLRRKEKP